MKRELKARKLISKNLLASTKFVFIALLKHRFELFAPPIRINASSLNIPKQSSGAQTEKLKLFKHFSRRVKNYQCNDGHSLCVLVRDGIGIGLRKIFWRTINCVIAGRQSKEDFRN